MWSLPQARRLLIALAATTALAACAGGASKPAPQVQAEAAAEPEEGTYKVGTPYQVDGVWYYPSENYSYVEEGIASWYGPDFHGKRTANGERYDMNALTAAHPTLPLPSVIDVTNLDNGRRVKLRINDRGPFKSKRILDVSRRAAQLLDFQNVGTARVRIEIDPAESLNLKNALIARTPGEMPKIAAAPRTAIETASLAPPTGVPQPAAAPAPHPAARSTLPAVAERPARVANARAEIPAGTGVYIQAGAFADSGNAKRLEQQLKEFGNAFIVTVTVGAQQLYRVRLGPLQDNEGANDLLAQIKSFGYEDAQIVRY